MDVKQNTTPRGLGLLDMAVTVYADIRPPVESGDWYEEATGNEYSGSLGATEVRRLTAGDYVPGLSAADNQRLAGTGYRKLGSRAASGDTVRPELSVVPDEPPALFADDLVVHTLRPGAGDQRLEFGALSSRLGVVRDVVLGLRSIQIGRVTALLLEQTAEATQQRNPSCVLRSKDRMVLNTAARRLICASWDLEFRAASITVIGPGHGFIAALLPSDGLAEILNTTPIST